MICFCLVSIIHSFLLFNFRYLFLLDIFVFTSSFGTYMLLVQKKFPWIIWAFSLTLFLFVWLWNEHDVCSPDWQFWLRLVLLFGSLICWVIVEDVPIYWFDCKQKDASNLLSLCTFELFRSIFHVCQSFRLSKSLGTSVVVFFKSLSKAPSSLYFPQLTKFKFCRV